ncbi:probable LRR receptor-like serine/threonine-protein kinase At2g16250 [Solanum tuberosum]|nr:PREDICTED: probable LRR receptor-like serine/threonine-protein kinase At2g16250 [Solanum tuberosum]
MRHQLGYLSFLLFLLFHSTFQQHEDRLALLQLRSSLGLRAREWPIKGTPCSNWRGISCNNGRVTGINISGFKRTRTGNQNPQFLVDSLQNLTLLESFNASNFALLGSIPDWFGIGLASLQVLDLSFCSITGAIPSTIGNLRSLAVLYISNNGLSGMVPSSLSQLLSLSVLDVSHNALGGSIPASFGSLGNLTLLDMSSNVLSGAIPPVIGTLSQLKFLNLSRNMLYGNLPPVIGRFSFLDISNNYFQGKVPQYWQSNVTLNRNCLQRLESQRDTRECASFYDERGLIFDNFGMPNAMELPVLISEKKSPKNVIISAAVLGVVGFIATVMLFVVLLICCCKRGVTNQRVTGVGPVPTTASPPPPPGPSLKFSSLGVAFNYQQILQTAGHFSDVNLIKHGHSGDIFRGILKGGVHVVVKRIDSSSVKKEAYLLELDFFSKVSHSRVVPFLGHCLESENEKFLVYKYMPNGDLSSSLLRKNNADDDSLQSLDWITRLKIAIGVAEGLSYLHHECNPPLVHRDVQASSILLDDKYEVRLGSLSEVCAQEGDTHQNKISRMLRLPQTSEQGASGTPNATCAYDVYCFGKVLLELVTGKLGISSSSDATIKDWLDKSLSCISMDDKELVTNIVDPFLIVDDDLLKEVWAMAIVARSCLNPKPSRRPLMRYILKALENPLKVVRQEHAISERLRATSSRGSWNATLFGSWRHSFSDIVAPPANKVEGASSFKKSATMGSQGIGQVAEGGPSFSTGRHSKEIFPEPLDVQDAERTRDEQKVIVLDSLGA